MRIKRVLIISITLMVTLVILISSVSANYHRLSGRESRKLLKLILAASFLAPPGFGVLPIPIPVPVPFAVESVKPPIIHPFPHGGGGGGFGGGFGGGGGGFHGGFGGGGFGGGGFHG